MMNSYSAYRYHPAGYLALVFTPEEDQQLIGWLSSPPAGFKLPKQAHFFGTEKIPVELLCPSLCSSTKVSPALPETPKSSEITVVPRRTSTMSAFERAQLKAEVGAQRRERVRQKAAAK